ncbi:MAG: hypothetical protein CTY13_00625 [Methylobacter sp.]|nr:MAG: hypothetical protein CTY13_00625 [Methylobacter sp.]
MNSQEQEIEANVKPQQDLENRRRFIKGAGIATPVVMTLASRSVFGAECLSQILSGNISHVGNGSCVKGLSPGSWATPDGDGKAIPSGQPSIENPNNTQTETVKAQWESINGQHDVNITFTVKKITTQSYIWEGTTFVYGELKSFEIDINSIVYNNNSVTESIRIKENKPPYFKNNTSVSPGVNTIAAPTGNTWDDYVNGSKFSDAFGSGSNDPMREILGGQTDSDDRHLVAAILNAHYFPNYILSVEQVIDLHNNRSSYPQPYTSLKSFLDSTWT